MFFSEAGADKWPCLAASPFYCRLFFTVAVTLFAALSSVFSEGVIIALPGGGENYCRAKLWQRKVRFRNVASNPGRVEFTEVEVVTVFQLVLVGVLQICAEAMVSVCVSIAMLISVLPRGVELMLNF